MSKEQDADFFRTLTQVLLLLVVIGVGAAILGRYLGHVERDTGDTVAERIAPVGQVNTDPKATLTAALPIANPAVTAVAVAPAGGGDSNGDPGKQTYETVCFACHATGLMNAPKFGDKALWAPRLSKGMDMLYEHALKGFNQMPARGGNPALSDDVVKAAVDYMAGAAGGAVKTPSADKAPPAAAAPAAPAETNTAVAATNGSTNGATPGPMIGKGKQIYDTVCFACHAAGVAGAPKFGDKALWAPRIAQGKDTLYKHALEGFFGKSGLMPPKGGRADLADEDIKAAVDYLTAAAQ